jgi:hypothetical protein
VAKRLDWEKEAKRLKVMKAGSRPLWEDLPIPTGSHSQHIAIAKQRRAKLNKKRKRVLPLQSPARKTVGVAKVKVFRRRQGERILPIRKTPKE